MRGVRCWFARLLGLVVLSSLVHCSTLKHKSETGPVTIEFKGKPGDRSETRYYSDARTKTYSDAQLLRERQEAVDFTVETRVVDVNAPQKSIHFKTKTIRKDGTGNLHELAFPEPGEEIDFLMRQNGEILAAGDYSPQSLFFVPSMPIPKHPVQVGDTWDLVHTWYSAQNSIPLRLSVVAILKGVTDCEGHKRCADIEVSGNVKLVATPTQPGANFDSKVWGRMLFSLERGDIVWSEMRSEESMFVRGDRTLVSSCMISEMKLGADYKTKPECEPGPQAVEKAPSL